MTIKFHGGLAAALLAAAAGTTAASNITGPTFHVVPQNLSVQCTADHPCVQPTVDGAVIPLEYADGFTSPIQDFVRGTADGTIRIMVTDSPVATAMGTCNDPDLDIATLPAIQSPCVTSTLFAGMRIARPLDAAGNPIASSGVVQFLFDARRNDTATLASANVPRSEDRMMIVSYSSTGTPTINQFEGNGTGWVTPSGFDMWNTHVAVKIDPNNNKFLDLELSTVLQPSLSFTGSEPLKDRLLGMAVIEGGGTVAGPPLASGSFPNVKIEPTTAAPAAWATLDFSQPTPVPLSLTQWNVGQMAAPVANGGNASLDDIAQVVATKETVCLDEVWESGDRLDLVKKVNAIRATNHQPPMNAVYEANDEVLRLATSSTGLMLLTSHTIIHQAIHHFPPDLCDGTFSDCLEDKGVLWARVGTPAGLPGVRSSASAIDEREFVDVFCTHVQAGDHGDTSDRAVRNAQFNDLQGFIAIVRNGGPFPVNFANERDELISGTWQSGTDRPAFLLGDMNTPGPDSFVAPKFPTDWSDPTDYNMMIDALGLTNQTDFEKASSLFAHPIDHDLNVQVTGIPHTASGTWLGTTDAAPSPIGVCGQNFQQSSLSRQNRYDYVLEIPPDNDGQLPTFALAANTGVSVDAHWTQPAIEKPPFYFSGCMSDHASVDVNAGLVRIADKTLFNASKRHHVKFAVTHLKDLASGGCCADWMTTGPMIATSGIAQTTVPFLDYNAAESEEIDPGWVVESGPPGAMPDLPAFFSGVVHMTVSVLEHDASNVDHYDSTPWAVGANEQDNNDIHVTFFATSGEISYVRGGASGADFSNPLWSSAVSGQKQLGNVNTTGGQLVDEKQGTTGDNGDDNNAVVDIMLEITEANP